MTGTKNQRNKQTNGKRLHVKHQAIMYKMFTIKPFLHNFGTKFTYEYPLELLYKCECIVNCMHLKIDYR